MNNSTDSRNAPVSPSPALAQVCPVCGLTASELRDSGQMGCATCYDVFTEMVAQAVTELHHPVVEPAPPPLSDRAATNPWPTRRAER